MRHPVPPVTRPDAPLLGARPLTTVPLALAVLVLFAVLVAGALRPAAADAPEQATRAPDAPASAAPEWPADVLDVMATIPIQAEGRIKPLNTFADYTLLGMNHMRSVRTPTGRKLEPLAWLLDVIARPDVARTYASFLVPTYEVLDAVGLEHPDKKKRDRYSYDELAPVAQQLGTLAQAYARKQAGDREPVENAIVDLSHAVGRFAALVRGFEFARFELEVGTSAKLREIFAGADRVTLSRFLEKAPEIGLLFRTLGSPHGAEMEDAESKILHDRLDALTQALRSASDMALLPPLGTAAEEPEWLTPWDVAAGALTEARPVAPGHLAILASLEGIVRHADDPTALRADVKRYHDAVEKLASARGEYEKIPLEVKLSRLNPFYNSLYIFLLAFLVMAFAWLKPGNRWLVRGVWALLGAGVVLLVVGIAMRCIIRERPPISTLYETILFITAFVVLASMVVEKINHQRIALSLAPILGALGLFIANKYEALDGKDTMPELPAVLDTNFWLATHVTCITIGYAAGLLASGIAHVHILGRLVGFRSQSPSFYGTVAKMNYGMLCFALFFAVVGTILGGIWANDSWGRFWGWDPKENGAMLICLSQLGILHARMGGYIKANGIAVATVFGGAVVAFSWWGVNLLQVGLHSYGFSQGAWTALKIFWGTQAAVMLAGGWLWWRGQRATSASAA